MKLLTTLIYKNRKFYIVETENHLYLSIEDKYVDENGKLNKQLNGITMNANKYLPECIQETKMQVDVDELVANGMEINEAILKVVLG